MRISCFSTLNNKFPVSIKAPVGELLQGCPMSEADFLAKQGKNEKWCFVLTQFDWKKCYIWVLALVILV